MKVAIIGAGGLVGSCAAFALQCGGVVRELALLDVNGELAEGQGLDLLHGGPSVADQVISAGGYEHIPTSDLICITAGLRRKPDESRLDLINRNVDLFLSILGEITKAGYKENATVLAVSNPVDVLTYLAATQLTLPQSRVLGLGTQLDTIRFRSLIALQLKVPPTQVSAVILGEHGDSMVPIWSSATIAGLPLEKFPGWSPNVASDLFSRTKGSGAEVIKKKGGRRFRGRDRHPRRDPRRRARQPPNSARFDGPERLLRDSGCRAERADNRRTCRCGGSPGDRPLAQRAASPSAQRPSAS